MKKKKGIILAAMMAWGALGMTLPVSAAETCNVSFSVTDTTENGYSGNIKVVMTDTKSDKTFEYVLTKGNSWGGSNIPKYTVDGDTIYSVYLSGMKSGFEIVNQDGSDITQFDASNDVDLKWKIVSVASNNITVKDESDTGESNVAISKEIQTGNEEADKLFNSFMDSIQFIKEDEKWVNFLESYELYADSGAISNSEEYAKATGGKKEDYLNMSSFDKFVYYETYVRMAQYLSFNNWERYYSSKENFDRNVIGPTVDHMKITEGDSTVVADAYQKLMNWQYQYIVENNSPYNFITGKNYLESKTTTTDDKSDEKNIINSEKEDEKGIWFDVKNAVGDNAISIVIAIILAGGVGCLTLYRKRRNFHESDKN